MIGSNIKNRDENMIDKNKASYILMKYAAYGALLGLAYVFFMIYSSDSIRLTDMITSDGIGLTIFIMILGAFVGVMVGVMCVISISIQTDTQAKGRKVSVPIISICAIFFMLIGGTLGIVLGQSGDWFEAGMFAGVFIGVIIGTAINALYYHQDFVNDVSEAIEEILQGIKKLLS